MLNLLSIFILLGIYLVIGAFFAEVILDGDWDGPNSYLILIFWVLAFPIVIGIWIARKLKKGK